MNNPSQTILRFLLFGPLFSLYGYMVRIKNYLYTFQEAREIVQGSLLFTGQTRFDPRHQIRFPESYQE